MAKQRCSATTKAGNPCKAWAVDPQTIPALCAAHGGAQAPPGAPAGNRNAETHGFYSQPPHLLETIDDAIAHLATSLQRLDQYIAANIETIDVGDVARLLAVQGQNLARYARMLKDQATLSGEITDDFVAIIDEAVEKAQSLLGVDLGNPQ